MILPQTGLPVTPDLSFIQLITFLIVLFICWLSFFVHLDYKPHEGRERVHLLTFLSPVSAMGLGTWQALTNQLPN